ncbi:MAG: type II secretion system protein GspD [Planctomycetota bacterium]|jgi:hypothetical protein
MIKKHLELSFSKASLFIVYAFVSLFVCGCGDFFTQKPIELHTEKVLQELSQIKENPNVRNPLPELYLKPAERMAVKDGVKLFYFTKHHPVDKLSVLITKQLAYKKVDTSSATNQLIIHCPSNEDANKAEEFLRKVDVPPIQVNIDCLVIERFADVTMDWETNIEIQNLLGEEITLGGKEGPEFPGASLREAKRSDFGLDVGFWRNKGIEGHVFRAVVDMLISRGYLTILMNPKLETVNGQKAKVMARDFAPIEKLVTTSTNTDPYNLTDYQWVEDILEVTPHVFADGSIGLTTKVTMGSKSKPEGVVQKSIITERTIEVQENRIKPGDSLVIGGIRKTEERGVIRGVPFLKDIPLIGVLFSSKDFEEKATEIIFILTPSISSGGVEYTKMIEEVRQQRETPPLESGIGNIFTDPFGSEAYKKYIEQKADEAKFEQFKTELEKEEAVDKALAEKTRAEKAQKEVTTAEKEVEKTHAEAKKTKAEMIEKTKAEAEKAKAEVQKAKAETQKVKAEAEKTKVELQKAKAEAEAAKKEAEAAKAEAEKAKQEAEKKEAPEQNQPKSEEETKPETQQPPQNSPNTPAK